MKLILNPAFESLRAFVESVPDIFENEGNTIYKGRNEIKVIRVEDADINVKRYKVPMLFNRFVYTFFRKSKGLRAFTYPQQILEKGFETPNPIAYIEMKKWGLIHCSFFISVQSPYTHSFYEFGNAHIDDCKEVAIAFARFTAQLHDSSIYHKDYSPGNILFEKIDGEYHFSLVDINRMSFGKVDIEKGCANFARLWGQTDFFMLIAEEYAKARGFNQEECIRLVLKARNKFWTKFKRKRTVEFNLDI
ncbi:lipopolysaccharide kinase InaA family protein [uncultured Bacteroides sp.]|uniref:lipopolysaccharide kinase InaA family protein n=1 Tax=uncultured Bacteroides sp. TaxID=162156 RepID=UPI002AA91668|nr:lipopolysaccharide kinase InaA family protein [uncultured Bacteroides sp.]